MKQKLYILDPSRHITGAFKAAQNEASILKDDFNITLVLPQISTIDKKELEIFSDVIYLPIYDLRKSLKSILIYLPTLLYSSFLLKKHMKKDDCKLLQINDYYLIQGVISKILGFKGKVFTWVRIDPTNYGSFFSKYWLKLGYIFSDKMISVSSFISSKLPKNEKNSLLYDPIQDLSNQNFEKKDQTTKKIIFVGNYTYGKGQQYAIEAFAKIALSNADAQLHFYGGTLNLDKNLEYKNSLIKEAKRLNLEKQIYFHSFVENIFEVLDEGYMALNFSESESFSMTCLEASLCSKSVVATKCGGPEEIIIDNKTGLLVEIGNTGQMAKAMDKLLKNSELNSSFGLKGKQHVEKKFSQEKFKNEIIDIFKGIN